jgi:hypothetical protein
VLTLTTAFTRMHMIVSEQLKDNKLVLNLQPFNANKVSVCACIAITLTLHLSKVF